MGILFGDPVGVFFTWATFTDCKFCFTNSRKLKQKNAPTRIPYEIPMNNHSHAVFTYPMEVVSS